MEDIERLVDELHLASLKLQGLQRQVGADPVFNHIILAAAAACSEKAARLEAAKRRVTRNGQRG